MNIEQEISNFELWHPDYVKNKAGHQAVSDRMQEVMVAPYFKIAYKALRGFGIEQRQK